MITWENYEEYIMLHADGELSVEEELLLSAFISKHPELKSELAAYDLVHLVPDKTVTFENKQSLIKPLPVRRSISFPVWQKYGIAAAVAALVFVSLFKWEQHKSNEAIAISDKAKPSVTLPKSGAGISQPSNTVQPIASTKPLQDNNINDKISITKGSLAHSQARSVHAHQKGNVKTTISIDAGQYAITELTELPLAEIKKAIVEKNSLDTSSLIEGPVYTVAVKEKAHKKGFFDKLFLDEANKHQLKTITGLVSGTQEQINNVKDAIANNNISIHINKETIVLNF